MCFGYRDHLRSRLGSQYISVESNVPNTNGGIDRPRTSRIDESLSGCSVCANQRNKINSADCLIQEELEKICNRGSGFRDQALWRDESIVSSSDKAKLSGSRWAYYNSQIVHELNKIGRTDTVSLVLCKQFQSLGANFLETIVFGTRDLISIMKQTAVRSSWPCRLGLSCGIMEPQSDRCATQGIASPILLGEQLYQFNGNEIPHAVGNLGTF